jgi:hypothetical protein
VIKPQSPRKGLHNLSRWMGVTALLEAQVVGGADSGQQRHLFATQTSDAATRPSNQADIGGTELLAPCA